MNGDELVVEIVAIRAFSEIAKHSIRLNNLLY